MMCVSLRMFILQVWPSLSTLCRNYGLSDWVESRNRCQNKAKLNSGHNVKTSVQRVERQQRLTYSRMRRNTYMCVIHYYFTVLSPDRAVCIVCACVYMHVYQCDCTNTGCFCMNPYENVYVCVSTGLRVGLSSLHWALVDFFVSHFEHRNP